MSGISGDLREVIEAADGGSSRARLAYDRFVLSIRRAVGAMAGVLGGVDAVVFTGGIGENSARVRRDVADTLRFAGLELADDANASSNADHDISAPASRVRVLVVRAREDLAILNEVLRLIHAEFPDSAPQGPGESVPDARVPYAAVSAREVPDFRASMETLGGRPDGPST